MSDQSQAIGTLLLEIADLASSAEDHGIVSHPPQDVLAPLIEQAQQLGVDVTPQATLADLHLAVELAAQVIADQANASRATATPPASQSAPMVAHGFAVPLPQVASSPEGVPTRSGDLPDSKT